MTRTGRWRIQLNSKAKSLLRGIRQTESITGIVAVCAAGILAPKLNINIFAKTKPHQ